MNFFLYLILLFFIINPSLSYDAIDLNNPSSVEIVPKKILKKDTQYYLGIKINLYDGWKTYWKNPGDSGLPLSIEWEKKSDLEKTEILFPFPQKYVEEGLVTIGYEKEVIFPVKLDFKDNLKFFESNLTIEYLVCKEICIPKTVTKEVSYDLENFDEDFSNYEIKKYFNQIPKQGLGLLELKKLVSLDNRSFLLIFNNDMKKEGALKIFPYSKDNILKIKSIKKEKDFFVEVVSDEMLSEIKSPIFFSVSDGKEFEEIVVSPYELKKNNKLIYYLFLAFVGGIILNFMPCVLPVLSLKLYSLMTIRKENSKKIRKYSLGIILGIVSSFCVLSILIISLRTIGTNVGWGFQFQNIYFSTIIAFVVLLFSFNLLGFFEIIFPGSFLRAINSLAKNDSVAGHFFSGAFATILATPCSAPFIGTAIGFSVLASNHIIVLIFLTISFGFAVPYILFTIYPNIIYIFPKPGKWMENFRYTLGVLLLATFIWLVRITNMNEILILFISTIILLFSLLLETNKFRLVLTFGFLMALFFWFLKPIQENEKVEWEKFNELLLNNYLDEDKIVFLDFTADWCITCKINKITTLDSPKLKKFFFDNDIQTIRADWTKKDDKILDFIFKYNRFGIPVNIVYGPRNKNGKILPEILTKDIVIDNINLVK